jgi:predicted P-loop ATPase
MGASLQEPDFIRDKDGKPYASVQDNIKLAIPALGVTLRENQFNHSLIFERGHTSGDLSDAFISDLWLEVDKVFHFRPQLKLFQTVAEKMARDNPFHPVKEYLDSLTWDETPRIDSWLIDFGGAEDTPYTRAVSRLILLAAVRRIREPGCKFDELPILESPQGFEKSTAIAALCPSESLFSDSLPLGADAKTTIEKSAGVWIFEAGELHGRRSRDVESLKASLSRQVDGPTRLAYGRLPVKVPRQFIIIGTTNKTDYLKDSTGNRRFWPVKVGRFKVAELRASRDQLWAEAVRREVTGESIRLPKELWPAAAEVQERARVEDPWEELLEPVLRRAGASRIPSYKLWQTVGLEDAALRVQSHNERLGEVMTHFGWRRTSMREAGEVVRAYVRNDLSGLEEEGANSVTP